MLPSWTCLNNFKKTAFTAKVIYYCLIVFISAASLFAQTVASNVKTKKYHALSCRWAIACTVNCIEIDKKEAIYRDAITCKVCNGGNIARVSTLTIYSNYTPA